MKHIVHKNQVRAVTFFLMLISSFSTAMAAGNGWAGVAVLFGLLSISGILEMIFMFLDTEEREVE